MHVETLAIHAGRRPDPTTGALPAAWVTPRPAPWPAGSKPNRGGHVAIHR